MIFEKSFQTELEKRLLTISSPDTDVSLSFLTHLAEATVEIWQKLGSTSSNSFGYTDSKNNFGEITKDIDVYARNILAQHIIDSSSIQQIALVTEEDVTEQYPSGVEQILFVDPIDGSSHIEYHSICGTFFSFAILDRSEHTYIPTISGYALYGHTLVLTLALGDHVLMATYDPDRTMFCMLHDDYNLPHRGKTYSTCDADSNDFPDHVQSYIEGIKNEQYKSRYNGVLVADLHRILMKGGIFISPKLKTGKTKTKRYFEAVAIDHIMRAAKGKSVYRYFIKEDILRDKQQLFSSVPLVFGSTEEVTKYGELIHDE
jgi:fructose-1,6-bisphosphatase I